MAKAWRILSTLRQALDLDNWSRIARLVRTGISLEPRCPLCTGPMVEACPLCAGCQRDLPWHEGALRSTGDDLDAVHASFAYAFPVDRLVTDAKFRGRADAARLLGTLMAVRPPPDLGRFDFLCPIPIPTLRLLRRGYNQALEMSRPLAPALDCRLDPERLARCGWQRPQSTLSAGARHMNLRDAFVGNGMAGAHVVLLDDVMTTGATLRAAARAARRAGALRVEAWVCAVA